METRSWMQKPGIFQVRRRGMIFFVINNPIFLSLCVYDTKYRARRCWACAPVSLCLLLQPWEVHCGMANSTVGGLYQDNSHFLNLHLTEIASLHQDNIRRVKLPFFKIVNDAITKKKNTHTKLLKFNRHAPPPPHSQNSPEKRNIYTLIPIVFREKRESVEALPC